MLQNVDAVQAVAYEPDVPQSHRMARQIVLATLMVIAICLAIIAFGLLAHMAH